MNKIIEYFQTLAVDANTQVKVLLTFLHLPVVAFLLYLARQERFLLIKNTHRKALLYVLAEFNSFCRRQHEAALQCIAGLDPAKSPGAELSCKGISTGGQLKTLWTVLLQNPSIFLYQRYALKTGAKLFELRDQIGFQQEHMHDNLQYFAREYRSSEKQYYENISGLAAIYDMLEENQAKKTLNKGNDPEWAKEYLQIFAGWRAGGAGKDMHSSHKEIVLKVLRLNAAYRDIPLVVRAGEIALKCDLAYTNIIKMRDTLHEKLQQFAWQHRIAYRVATLVMNSLDPKAAARPFRARLYKMTERRLRIMEQDMHKLAGLDFRINRRRTMKKALYAGMALLVLGSIALALFPVSARPKQPNPPAAGKPSPPAAPRKDTVSSSTPPATGTNPLVFIQPVPRVYGIDISKYQGDLLKDLNNLDTLHFVICKATEGNTYTDPDFETNWKFIREKGLVRGAYHFYHSNDNPVTQAQHFLQAIKNIDSADIAPVIDIEDGSLEGDIDTAALENNLLLFLHYIEQNLKRKPLIYTDLFFADTYLVNNAFGDYPLWLAEYSGKNAPQMPKAWKGRKYAIWQKKDSYKINSRNTDFDVFNGSGTELVDFIRKY